MARGKKNKMIEGQLSFNFCMDTTKYVCQANTLVGGRQALSLNSAKLIRAAIMQIQYDDKELYPYIISIPELAKLLKISRSNIYRDIEKITDDIIQNPVFIKEETPGKIRWLKIPWVTRCEYHSDIGVAVKLNDELKPFLLNLKERYTQYELDNVLSMKSVYAIRLFELLQEKILSRTIPKDGINVELSVNQIRECCDCQDKYKTFANFKARVIDSAVNEIERVTSYSLSYKYIKKGRAVVGILFNINMCYH